MSILLKNLEPTGTRWGGATVDYPQGTFINGSGQGNRDGSYAKAEWANEIFGVLGAILTNGGQTPNGQVETARNSQVFNALKQIIKNDVYAYSGDPAAEASGTVNAITATFTKPVALEGGQTVKVRAIGSNTSPVPTFNPNGLGAKPIVKGDNDPLAVGDIAGSGYWITLIYDATLQKWVLQNPATGVTLVLPNASTTQRGIIQLATAAEMTAETDTLKAVTVKVIADYLAEKLKEGAGVPAGTMAAYAGKTIPEGWLICNGAAVSRTTYANLFAEIGTIYGAGDGSTTFNLPNLDARYVQYTTSTSKVGTKLKAGLPNITGDAGTMCGASDSNASGAFTRNNWGATGSVSGSWFGRADLGFLASRSSGIFGASSTVQPLSVQQLAIIKI